ncbi:uncharacterized protein LOC113343977 [Papaver somniferum]|uniref:uncharacterized protein LOC113343977 n=1 Tax=Papaver somniferum TaxID=3469 RepID=UPI000E6FAAB2|nr:uncharacterized protein LOC113343977 [Papaver somniferum]
MRVFFWNINGVSREEARCKLHELVKEFKPDIFCLAEPKVSCSNIFIRRLKLNGYDTNVIHNSSDYSISNLWVFTSTELDISVVVNMSRQTISISVDGVCITFVHASYLQVTRRRLWEQLNMDNVDIPWLLIGDFNCILRLEEKKGGREPHTCAINEFGDWMEDNLLFEADALGNKFTWSNCQSGSRRIISKLDRAVINATWLAKYENWRCKALPR